MQTVHKSVGHLGVEPWLKRERKVRDRELGGVRRADGHSKLGAREAVRKVRAQRPLHGRSEEGRKDRTDNGHAHGSREFTRGLVDGGARPDLFRGQRAHERGGRWGVHQGETEGQACTISPITGPKYAAWALTTSPQARAHATMSRPADTTYRAPNLSAATAPSGVATITTAAKGKVCTPADNAE